MKKKSLIIAVLILFTASVGFAQKGVTIVEIETNPHCISCKKTIETELVYTKGIKDAVLDMETKIVTVKFKESKISEEEIAKIIINLGYEAKTVSSRQ